MTLNRKKFSGARISMAQMSAILASFLPGILPRQKTMPARSFYASLRSLVLCGSDADSGLVFPGERSGGLVRAALRAKRKNKT